jgi:hypothetical protein
MAGTNTLEERNWRAIAKLLPEGWKELAVQLGVIKEVPKQLGAKVTNIEPLLRVVLFHVSMNMSLRIATATAAAARIIDISPVALHLRMRKLGVYLRELLSRMLESHRQFAPARWAGYEAITADGTSLVGPGAKGTSARVHYAVRLEDVNLVQVDVSDETGGETLKRFIAKPGELWIVDRGYANPPGIHSIVAQGAEVLARVNRGSLPLFDAEEKPLDLFMLARKLKSRGQISEREAWIHPQKKAPLRGRLLLLHLPPAQAQEARERVREEEGPSVTPETLEWAEYVALWTSVPKERLSKEQLYELYRARWQVELHIKRDKSITGLDAVPNFRKDTIETWLLAKLLAQQLALRLAAPSGAFSP